MDINKFRIFLAVADAGSFGKASEKTGYTQAGISYVIKSLEDEIGVRLFSRTSTGVRLTDSGKVLLPEIRRVVGSFGSFESTLVAQKTGNMVTIHVGVVDTVAIKWLPRAVELFRKRYPDVLVDANTGDPFEMKEWLERGEADLGICERAWEDRRFRWIHLADDPYVVVFPPGTNAPSPCPFDYLDGKAMYISDYGRERIIPEAFQSIDVTTVPLNDKICNPALVNMIAHGKGCTIMSALSMEACGGGLEGDLKPEIVPLGSEIKRDINIAVREENVSKPVLKNFINCFKEAVAEAPIKKYD
ncbi:MAG: LysR family transcriptional regulator [Firmicutes bacterium]|nr:LysR family transcriptional regulator [Bacillota bacterium]